MLEIDIINLRIMLYRIYAVLKGKDREDPAFFLRRNELNVYYELI
jgi:hypothetical protein